MTPSPSWREPSNTYDPNCVPKRYSPCPAQLLDMQIGAGRPGLSPNTVVMLVFLVTVVVWVACFFFFMWWLKRDAKQIKAAIEDKMTRSQDGNGGGGIGNGANK